MSRADVGGPTLKKRDGMGRGVQKGLSEACRLTFLPLILFPTHSQQPTPHLFPLNTLPKILPFNSKDALHHRCSLGSRPPPGRPRRPARVEKRRRPLHLLQHRNRIGSVW